MNHVSRQTNGNGIDELLLFTRITTGLAALTGILYLRVVLGGSLVPVLADQFAAWLTLTASLLVIGIIGALLTWRWQGIGAAVLLLAGLSLGLAFYWPERNWGTAVFYGSPFVVAGALCTFCWLRKR